MISTVLVRDQLQQLVNSKVKISGFSPVRNIILRARTGNNEYALSSEWKNGKMKIGESVNNQFKIGSITKMLIGLIILQMEEEQLISIQDPVAEYLAETSFIDIDKLHVFENNAFGRKVQVKDLLMHRSGIADIFRDSFPRFHLYQLLNLKQSWTAEKIVKWFFRNGVNRKAHFCPGDGFYYSDMNYVLLGLIIEIISNRPLSLEMKTRVFTPLAMDASGLEYYEQFDCQNLMDTFLSRWNVSRSLNTSYDWGGGGVISSSKDLLNFIRCAYEGLLFKNRDTLQKMKETLPTSTTAKVISGYGMGVYKFRYNGDEYYGHDGNWGSLLIHNPEKMLSLCFTTNQALNPFDIHEFTEQVVRLVDKEF